MNKILLILGILISQQALAVNFVLGLGPDAQVSSNDLDPQGSFNEPDSDSAVGGALLAHIDIPVSERIGIRTGAELVQRFLKQDYDFWLFSNGNGSTRYDVLSVDVPIYMEIYMGGGKHNLYFGPKLAFSIYDHCSQSISDPADAYPCQQDAVKKMFFPFQVGYIIKFTDYFGLNVFTEISMTNIVDKNAIESKVSRAGITAQFYF